MKEREVKLLLHNLIFFDMEFKRDYRPNSFFHFLKFSDRFLALRPIKSFRRNLLRVMKVIGSERYKKIGERIFYSQYDRCAQNLTIYIERIFQIGRRSQLSSHQFFSLSLFSSFSIIHFNVLGNFKYFIMT